jgi:phenylpropionate dioxygenase-like ring-hydroxylating dioxygenase large terminal subunit
MSETIEIVNQPVDYTNLVRQDKVHASMYTNPQIFDQEMNKIFNNTWVYLGHESELPESGSFITSFIGLQPVVVTRDRKKNLHVMLNRCKHRGATVCEGKRGKVRSLTCPYHGWGYSLDGDLRAIPKPEQYEGVFDKDEMGLDKVRHDIYNGMIFGTMKDDMEPLEEFLGGAKKWINLFMKQCGGYPLKVLGDHRFRFPGNWKIQLENTTDAYHFPIVHKSFVSSVDDATAKVFDFLDGEGYVEDLGNGHSVMVMIPELVDLEANLDEPIPERFQNLADELAAEGHSDEEIRRLVRAVGGSGFNLNLFPNGACSMAFFRVLIPKAYNETEIHHVAIGGDGAPQAFNNKRLRLHEHFQGPLGFGTPDDGEAWKRVQAGAMAGDDGWILLNRGSNHMTTSEDGNPAGAVCSETGMRAAYQAWKKMMTV